MALLLAPLLFGVAGSSSSEWSSAFQVEGRGSSAVKFVRRSLPSLCLWHVPAPHESDDAAWCAHAGRADARLQVHLLGR